MLDEKNQILFEHLLAYARFRVKQLARVIHSSQATVIKRIKYLEEQGFIERYDAIINWQKLPLIKKVYHLKINQGELQKSIEMLLRKSLFSLLSRQPGLRIYKYGVSFPQKDNVKYLKD